jgi:N-acyl-phosphatidylethanolamine-hydrolysing phospholipase D
MSVQEKGTQKIAFDLTCTPGQHFTGRGIMDRFKTLWAGWAVVDRGAVDGTQLSPSVFLPLIPRLLSFSTLPLLWSSLNRSCSTASNPDASPAGVRIYHGGDTGYRAVLDGQNEDEVPFCPAFQQIGEKFGGFEFAMIPIGLVSGLSSFLYPFCRACARVLTCGFLFP